MTAHELAYLLLDGPDLPVTIYQYDGGSNTLHEVHDVAMHAPTYYQEEVLLLQTCAF